MNGENYALYSSPNIFMAVKSWILRQAGHTAQMGESQHACECSHRENPTVTDHLEDQIEGENNKGERLYFSVCYVKP
jgi:hypothetical protein